MQRKMKSPLVKALIANGSSFSVGKPFAGITTVIMSPSQCADQSKMIMDLLNASRTSRNVRVTDVSIPKNPEYPPFRTIEVYPNTKEEFYLDGKPYTLFSFNIQDLVYCDVLSKNAEKC